MRPGDGVQTAEALPDPRNAAAVIEAQNDLGVHAHTTGISADQADQIDLAVRLGRWHEIDDGGTAGVGLEAGFEDAGFTTIAPCAVSGRLGRRDQPAAVLRLAKQRGKDSFSIKAWQTQPIDGTVAPY